MLRGRGGFGRGRGGGFGRGVATGAGMVVGASIARGVQRRVMRNNWAGSMSRRPVMCFHCGRQNQPNNHFCGFCGMNMFDDPRGAGLQCFECGFVCASGVNFCSNCGSQF